MRTLKTVLAFFSGCAALFFLVMSGSGGRAGMVVGLIGFGLFALLTFLFGRKTKADKRREAIPLKPNPWDTQATSYEANAHGNETGRWLILTALAYILISPIVILAKLLKMQE